MSKVAEVFNSVASIYDDWYNQPKGNQVFEAEFKLMNKYLPKKGLGLEIGAGTGIFAEKFTDKDRLVICLDLSKHMLNKARERGLPTIQSSATLLPIRSNLLDFSYLITAIEFMDNPMKMMSEVKATIKQDSSLVILFINKKSKWGQFYTRLGEMNDPVFSNAHLYDFEEIREKMVKSDFKLANHSGTLTKGPEENAFDTDFSTDYTKVGVIAIKSLKT